MNRKFFFLFLFSLILIPAVGFAGTDEVPKIAGIRLEFIIFGLTLLGVALLHHHTLKVALSGLAAVLITKFIFSDFHLVHHLQHEWDILVNLFGLLLGFAILARHFEDSGIPKILPDYLPDDWKGGFYLLMLIFIMSGFLDNIAAAIIGGTIALTVFKGRVHIGYLAAIVAASNAGGAGSVLGDTTTTMMWIAGKSYKEMIEAYAGAFPALLVFGIFASLQQDKYQRIEKDAVIDERSIDSKKLIVVGMVLIGAVATNVLFDFPSLGVWIAILLGSLFSKTEWKEAGHAIPGTIFLLSLVLTASMMPVDQLPSASWQSAFFLGFISSVFDNIPLTKLALTQGGYDWGILAYAVGYGGSMVWFGSSAGVAISNIYPEAKSVFRWIKYGWHVVLAYIIGFMVMIWLVGWAPEIIQDDDPEPGIELLEGEGEFFSE